MKRYKKCYELKNTAKDKLDGKYGSAVLICFLASLLSTVASLAVSGLLPGTDSLIALYTIQALVSFLLSWILGILDFGLTFYFLKAACGQGCSADDLFYGFRGDSAKILTVSGVRAFVNALCVLPTQYLLDASLYRPSLTLALCAVLAALLGICIHLAAGLALMLSFFVMLDFPDKSAREILELSFRLIRGRRKSLFYLQLSFLPLEFLCICSLFIGYLWLAPYRNMAYTCYFLDLMNPAETAPAPVHA